MDAEFGTLIEIESEEIEREKLRKAGKLKGGLEELAGKKIKEPEVDENEARAPPMNLDDDSTVPLWIFLKFTNSLADKFKDVQKRLISAFGIDSSNDKARLSWEAFLRLRCFFDLFTTSTEDLQDIWLKCLDERGLSQVFVDDFIQFIERTARGSMSKNSTPVSLSFANEML